MFILCAKHEKIKSVLQSLKLLLIYVQFKLPGFSVQDDVQEDLLGQSVGGLGHVVGPDHLVVPDLAIEELVLHDLVVRGAAAHLHRVRLGPGRPSVAQRLGPGKVRPDQINNAMITRLGVDRVKPWISERFNL